MVLCMISLIIFLLKRKYKRSKLNKLRKKENSKWAKEPLNRKEYEKSLFW